MTFPAFKAVLFDAYGTLFDVHAPVARVAAELGENASAISDLWRAKQLQYTWLRSLMHIHADFEQVTADALDYAVGAHGVNDRAMRDRLLGLYMTLDAYPDAVSALRLLKRHGIATGILSNGSPKMLDSAVASAGLGEFLDHVLSVEPVGVYKPDPSVYRLGEQHLRLPREEIGFVSANGWDAAGAAQYGFNVIHLNRFDQPREVLPAGPALVLKTLDEAAAALTGLQRS
ncbi:MAG: haloacid dehalogenase type II [Rhodomicrobiaceae bacterium]